MKKVLKNKEENLKLTTLGFTLIELLAVIVILAIIALIATPIILNIIEKTRKSAFMDSAYGLISAAKLKYAENFASNTKEDVTYIFPQTEDNKLQFSGSKPQGGSILVDATGKVSIAIHNGKWCAKKDFDSEKITIEAYTEEECIIKNISKEILDGTAVYFNPETGTKCNTYVEENSAAGIKTGCMKWYTFAGNNNDDKVNLILDHNTTNYVIWTNYDNYGDNYSSILILEQLKTDTNDWVGVNERSDYYDDPNKSFHVDYTGYRARLIEANELARITGHNTWNSASEIYGFNFNANGNYDWLKENDSYWTISSSHYVYIAPMEQEENHIWYVSSGIHSTDLSFNKQYGVRPVITISKSVLR